MLKENVEPNLNGREERINKDKIIKYASVILTGSIVFSGIGVCAVEAAIDHTKEICPITSSLTNLENETMFNFGINHQISRMEHDYEKLGHVASVNYNAEDNTFITRLPKLGAPAGYTLETEEDGVIACVKTTKKYVEPLVSYDEEGNVIYMAPVGYVLETREDGTLICTKTTKEYTNPNITVYLEELPLTLTKRK